MATQIFLGNPSSNIIDWIKGKQQQQTATIKNMTGSVDSGYGNGAHIITLTNTNPTHNQYVIQPKEIKNIIPGTYHTSLRHQQYSDHFAYDVELNGTSLINLDFHTNVNTSENYTTYDGIYTYENNNTYEFLYYGQQPL